MDFLKPENEIHNPVLVQEILSLFSQKNPPKKILDCTFGRGGHSLAFLKAFPEVQIKAIDCDHQALEYANKYIKEVQQAKIHLSKGNFHNFVEEFKEKEVYDLVLMDLGVSSPQLDQGERGFSFYHEGPLDMRMDQTKAFKAEDIINSWSREDLNFLFQKYGEIKNPQQVVAVILKVRKKKRIQNTLELAQLIQSQRRNLRNKHPATKWFLALRIAVNQELEGLSHCLPSFLNVLKAEAYFAVISFHSLEDRIVKRTFRKFVFEKKGILWNKKACFPSLKEKKNNKRSRSAKLRVFQKKLFIPPSRI